MNSPEFNPEFFDPLKVDVDKGFEAIDKNALAEKCLLAYDRKKHISGPYIDFLDEFVVSMEVLLHDYRVEDLNKQNELLTKIAAWGADWLVRQGLVTRERGIYMAKLYR